jgi:hypothetical protein
VTNELFTARNVNGHDYRVSIVRWRKQGSGRRKWITVAQRSPARELLGEGEWEVSRHIVVAEAAAWRGRLSTLLFKPTLIINYESDRPQRLNENTLREILPAVVEEANLAKLTSFEEDDGLNAICYPNRLVPMVGYRTTLLRRRVPHLLLFEWPADRAFLT